MSDAAARALAASDLPKSREEAQEWYANHLWAEVEQRRGAAQRKAADNDRHREVLRAGLDDIHAIQHQDRTGPVATATFLHWLRTGEKSLAVPGLEHKASLVLDATGKVLVPADLTVDVLREAGRQGVFRRLADVRPTVRSSQQAGLIGTAAVGWGRLETGTAATEAGMVPESPVQEVEVHDLLALAKIGVDLLDDSPESARAAIVESIAAAIAAEEDAKFAGGSDTGQPKGLALAANVTRVPAAQKVAVSVTNTPTAAQLVTIPWKLHSRYRDDAVWLMHPTSAEKVAALTHTSGDALWPNPGPQGPGLLGWPAYVVDGLPDPATAGTGDASIWFLNLRSAYRVVARSGITVQRLGQRFAVEGIVGFLVTSRVGGELIKPEACVIYTQ
jgi:HK97 family phage major capsid protein